jgi:hypothetical protein
VPRRPGQVLAGDGFEIETLLILRAADAGLRIVEVPSHEANRIHGASNLNAFRDGRRVLRTIMTEYRAGRRQHAVAPVSPAPDRAGMLDSWNSPTVRMQVLRSVEPFSGARRSTNA